MATAAHGNRAADRPPRALRPTVTAVGGLAVIVVGAVATVAGLGSVALGVLLLAILVGAALQGRMGAPGAFAVVCVLVLLVPARLGVATLGAAGAPSTLLGLGCLFAWVLGLVAGRPRLGGRNSGLRWGLLGVVVTTMISYVASGFRLPDAIEMRGADRGLLTLASVLGLALLASEIPRDRAVLRRIVAAITSAGAIVALLGVIDFFIGVDLTAKVSIPGFSDNPAVQDLTRSGFTRIMSTTSHPIELSGVLDMLLPLALYLLLSSSGRARRWWMTCTFLIAAAIPMTVSRTGVVGMVVAFAVLVPTWSWQRRRRFALTAVVGVVGARAMVPGLVGTLRGALFDTAGDTSIMSRAMGRQRALAAIADRPWFGRGFGTYLPQRYGYIDNQTLLGAVEVGLVGQAAYAALFGIVGILALQVRTYATGVHRDDDRSLSVSLLASVLVSISTWFTYDALNFPTERALTFVVLGLVAALWRLVKGDQADGVTQLAPSGPTLQTTAQH